jgi:chromosome partitioning protein
VYNLLLEEGVRLADVVISTGVDGVDLIPSNIDLSAAELVLVSEVAREQALLRSLSPARESYDFLLLDCPPSLGLLTVNALTAADGVLVPVACEFYALRGLALLMRTIAKVRERLNPRLQLDGVVATMFDARTLHGREVLGRLKEAFPEEMFETVVPRTVRFQEAPVAGKPVLEYAPGSSGAEAYRQLARELVGRLDSE